MVAAFYKRVRTDDEYNEIRAKYEDTTSVEAQIAALESLGLKAVFRKDGDADLVERELEAGRPVLVGWLHAEHASGGAADVQWPGLGIGRLSAAMQARTAVIRSGLCGIREVTQRWRKAATATRTEGETSASGRLRFISGGKQKALGLAG